jgi:hypothetical protein
MYIGFHVKYLLFLSDFNETWNASIEFRNRLKYQISWTSAQLEPSCAKRTEGRTDRQTDMTKLRVAFHNSANAPNKTHKIYENFQGFSGVPAAENKEIIQVTYWEWTGATACLVSQNWPGNNVALKCYCEMPYISLIRKPLFFCAAIYLKRKNWPCIRGYTIVK